VIGVELDLHAHMTLKRMRATDVFVLYKEYPHTDFEARANELIDIVLGTIRGALKPRMSLYDCRVVTMFPTSRQPMRAFVDKCAALEGKDGVLSVSINHGFPYADVPELGARMLVVTDDRKAHGDRLAEELGRELIEIAKVSAPPTLQPDEAISAAQAEAKGPVVIADSTDNPGGGAPADNTTFIRRLIERKIPSAAVAPLWDPVAARICVAAGTGARFQLRFGGKTAITSGVPVDAEIEVLGTVPFAYQTFAGSPVPLGPAAGIRVLSTGLEVVVNAVRGQAMGLDLFSQFGIDPTSKKILVVKSDQHFYAAFSTIASRVIYADGDGPQPKSYASLPLKRAQRPLWPLDQTITPKLVF
jgi:microcystin degradation protein MlrC